MSAVPRINPSVAAVEAPAALRSLQGWLVWRYEHHEGEAKPRKVPCYTGGGKRYGVQGRPEDRRQLTTFDAARAAAARRGMDGVGLALLEDFGVVALDFDNCVTDGRLAPEVERIIAETYAEFSPSGRGVRAFMRGNLGNRKDTTSPAFGFETFSTKGFVTFTGNRLPLIDVLGLEDTIAEVSEPVRALCAARFGRVSAPVDLGEADDPLMVPLPIGLTREQIVDALDVLDPDADHDTWLHVGMGLHHETGGEGFDYWNDWSAKGSKYPGEEALQRRWDSFGREPGRPVTARYMVKLANEQGARVLTDAVSLDDFDDVSGEPEGDKPALRFPVTPIGEFARGAPPGWIIKGILPRAELVVLFGASGAGKSFVALDMAAAIAQGREWRGHRTHQGRVVYLAAEGGGGFRNRATAYGMHHGVDLDSLPFGVIVGVPNLLQKADAVDVAKSVVTAQGADVVIVDTFAQVTAGANENAGEDIGRALAHCRGIHRATGAVVVLVHHAGKDASKGARGWSGLRAAADAEIEVTRSPMGRAIRISKQKDGVDGLEFGFELQTVNIGMDDDGDIIDSCVVVEAALPATSKVSTKALGYIERTVVEVINEIAESQTVGIEVEFVIAETVRRLPAPEGGRDTRKQRVRRALAALSEGDESPYFVEDGCISIV